MLVQELPHVSQALIFPSCFIDLGLKLKSILYLYDNEVCGIGCLDS